MIKKNISIILIVIMLIINSILPACAVEVNSSPFCPKTEAAIREILRENGLDEEKNLKILEQGGSVHLESAWTEKRSINIVLPSGERIPVESDADIQKTLDQIFKKSSQDSLEEKRTIPQNTKTSTPAGPSPNIVSQPKPELSMLADRIGLRAFVLLKDGKLMAYDLYENADDCLMENVKGFIFNPYWNKILAWTDNGDLWALSMANVMNIDVKSKTQLATDVIQIGNDCFLRSNGDLYTTDLNWNLENPWKEPFAARKIAENVMKFANDSVYITNDHVLHYSAKDGTKTTETYQLSGFSDIYTNSSQDNQDAMCSAVYFAFSDDGRLYGWGDNSRGGVGCGPIYDSVSKGLAVADRTTGTVAVPVYVTTPTEIATDKNIVSIISINTGIYAWTVAGDLFCWGDSPIRAYRPLQSGSANISHLIMPDSIYCYPHAATSSNPVSSNINGIKIKEDGTLLVKGLGSEKEYSLPVNFSNVVNNNYFPVSANPKT